MLGYLGFSAIHQNSSQEIFYLERIIFSSYFIKFAITFLMKTQNKTKQKNLPKNVIIVLIQLEVLSKFTAGQLEVQVQFCNTSSEQLS